MLRSAFRRRSVVGLIFWSAFQALPVVAFGRCVAKATDAFLGGRVSVALGWLGLLAVAAAAGAFGTARSYGPLAAVVEPFRDQLVRRVVAGAVDEAVRTGRAGNAAVARLTQHVEIVRDTLAGVVTILQGFVFTLTGTVIGLATLAPATLPLVLPPAALGLALFAVSVRRAAAHQRRQVLAEEAVAESATGLADALRDITACGAEDAMAADAGRLIDAQAAAARAVARMAAVRTIALAVGGRLPMLLILMAAPWLLRHGASPGTILGALSYVLLGLSPALHTIVRGLGGSGLRLKITLDRIIEAAVPPTPPSAGRDGGEVRLSGVTFGYGPEPVVADLSLTVPDDDHLAIVGPSGGGKSTLVALLAGLLIPDEGTVTLGGNPADEVAPGERVIIPQEAYVFGGTLRENLLYLAPDADVTRLADWDLGDLDAVLDPAAMSAGRRQLVALGRAFLSDARLVVLDEATCHLDGAVEEQVEHAFAARPGALVVVAHRMSSARRADRILVLDGVRAWLGEHDELLADCPLYRDLHGNWSQQPDVGDERPRQPDVGGDRSRRSGVGGGWSQPAGVVGDSDGVDSVAGADLADDAGHVVADGAYREEQVVRDLRG